MTPNRLNDVAAVTEYKKQVVARIATLGLKGEDAASLIHLYGRQTDHIIDRMMANRTADPDLDLLLAELWYLLHHEMIVKANDFFVRRTGLLYFDLPRLVKLLDPALQSMAHYLNWDIDRLREERSSIEEIIQQTLLFKN